MLNKNKQAQSEAVGFVIIILIVVIAGVIFLGIFLRNSKPISTESFEIANFLSASLSYTTLCYKDSPGDYKTLGDLADYCSSGVRLTCPTNKTACSVLNETYSDMLSKFKPAGTLSYYQLSLSYNNSETQHTFMTIESGTRTSCTSRISGNSQIEAQDGKIIVDLMTCLAS